LHITIQSLTEVENHSAILISVKEDDKEDDINTEFVALVIPNVLHIKATWK